MLKITTDTVRHTRKSMLADPFMHPSQQADFLGSRTVNLDARFPLKLSHSSL